jgi:hypothetical protein
MKKVFVLLSICLGFLLVSCDDLTETDTDDNTRTEVVSATEARALTETEAAKTEYMQFTFDEVRFNQERALWESLNIQNYSYEQFQGYSDLIDRFRVTVEGGDVANEVVLEDSGTLQGRWYPLTETEAPRLVYGTLDDLYKYLEDSILYRQYKTWLEEGCDGGKIVINYDPVYHFPTSWEFTEYYDVSQEVIVLTTITLRDTPTGSEEISREVTVTLGEIQIRYCDTHTDYDTRIENFTPVNQPLD